MPQPAPNALTAYSLILQPPQIRPAPGPREWMDQTSKRYANRCLPLHIANMHGWELLTPETFTICWDGRRIKESISIEFGDKASALVQSHFGHGIITMLPGYLFVTPPGYNLWVKGPANRPKDGIVALEGIIETDWLTAPFTMNWQLTRPKHRVTFEKGEPFCTIVPIKRGSLEQFEPQIRPLASNPELDESYRRWRVSRNSFLDQLVKPGSDAQKRKWQKDYFKGIDEEGQHFPEHQTKLNLKPFKRITTRRNRSDD